MIIYIYMLFQKIANLNTGHPGFDFGKTRTTHKISVRPTAHGEHVDDCNKEFPISAAGRSVEDIHGILLAFVEGGLKEMFEERIVLESGLREKPTHRIGVLQPRAGSKWMSVSFPSYSTVEVANEIHRHLCGGEELR